MADQFCLTACFQRCVSIRYEKIIAWISMMLSDITFAALFLMEIYLIHSAAKTNEAPVEKPGPALLPIIITLLSLVLILQTLSVVTSVLIIVGINKKKPHYIRPGLVILGFGVIVHTVLVVADILARGINHYHFAVFVSIGLNIFFLFSLHRHYCVLLNTSIASISEEIITIFKLPFVKS